MTKYFKFFNWKLLLAIFLTLFIPVLYRTTRIFFVGDMPNSHSSSIAGNMQWIGVLFEVLEEAFLFPLFFFISNIIKSKNKIQEKIIGKIIIIIVLYLVAITFFIAFAKQMLEYMSPKTFNLETLKFVRIEFASRLFIMIFKLLSILMIAKNLWKKLIGILLLHIVSSLILDIFLISQLQISLKMGVTGIAIIGIVTYFIVSFVSFIIIWKEYSFKLIHVRNVTFYSYKKDWKQNVYSGLESLVRNAFFIIFVLKIVNRLPNAHSQGDWWIFSTFMWDWLLVPVIAISRYANYDMSITNKKSIKEKVIPYFTLISITIMFWLILIPVYKPFLKHVMNAKRFEIIYDLTLISLGFYIMVAYNMVIDKMFYAKGKAQYILFQSLITNIVVYIPFYYLKNDITLTTIAIMFGTALAVDSLLTLLMFVYYLHKNTKKNKNFANTL